MKGLQLTDYGLPKRHKKFLLWSVGHTHIRSDTGQSRRKASKGYTIIEILIVLSILVLLFFGGYGAYREFARRQILDNFYKEMRTDLGFARELAISGEKPTGCSGTLSGYQVDFASGVYNISAVCASNVLVRSRSIPGDVQVSGFVSFSYKVLGQGTTLAGPLNVTFSQASTGRAINATVTKEGILQQ